MTQDKYDLPDDSRASLPQGWEWARLADVIFLSKERQEPKDLKQDKKYIGLEHIESKTNRILAYASSKEVVSTKNKFNKGDVLYGKLRPYLNKVCIPDFDGICSTDILVFKSNDFIISEYLLYLLTMPAFVEFTNMHMRGVQHPRISFDDMGGFAMPIAPLKEQKRIVAKVEKLLERVNKTREELARIPLLIKKFRQSVLAKALKADLDSLPQGWNNIPLKNLVSSEKNSIKRGPFGGSIKKSCFVASGYKIYEQKNAIYNDFTLGKYYISKSKFKELEDFEVKPGDLIISCSGTIGKIAVAPKGIEKGIINQALLKLTLNNSIIETEYFVMLFNSYLLQAKVLDETHGSGMANISSVKALKEILFPFPSLKEQRRLLKEVNYVFARADEIAKALETAQKHCDKMTQSILSKAFRGELVPQDPKDEPASILLERIKKEKQNL